MTLIVVFILGVGNFALHGAVLGSDHPLLGHSPWFMHLLGGRVTLLSEFMLLLAALLFAGLGFGWACWAYLGYSMLNAIGGWLILTRRV